MQAAGSQEMRHLLNLAFTHSVGMGLDADIIQSGIAQRIEQYRQMLATPDLGDSGQGILFQRGLHSTQRRSYQSGGHLQVLIASAIDDPIRDPPELELIASLEMVATANLVVANQMLPKALQEAAEQWSTVDAEGQIRICEAVYDSLLSNDPEEPLAVADMEADVTQCWLRDYNDQPVERIFPRMFLKEGGRPNCFGKGQLLTAFARRVNARHYGATPVMTTEDFVHPSLLKIMDRIGTWAAERGIALPKRLQAAFERRKIAERALESAPNRFHMALVIELKDGRWYFIDPHMRCRGLLNNAADMKAATKLIDFNCVLLPGYAVLTSEAEEAHQKLLKASMDAGAVIDVSHRLLRDWEGVSRNPSAVLPLLSRDHVLELLIEERVGLSEEQVELSNRALRGEQFFFLSFRAGPAGEQPDAEDEPAPLVFRDRGGQPVSVQIQQRLHIALQMVLQLSDGKAMSDGGGFNAEALSEAMMKVLGILQAIAYRRACKGLSASRTKPGIVHPMFELYEPSFRIGVELIAHLNCLHGEANSVVMQLASVCGGQHHLLLAATESLRTNEADSTLARDARETLESSPVRLSAANSLFVSGVSSNHSQELVGV